MFQTSNQKNSWIWRISGIQPDHDWAPCGISRGSHDRINIHKGSWGSAMKKLHSESLGSDVFWDQWLEILAFSLQTMYQLGVPCSDSPIPAQCSPWPTLERHCHCRHPRKRKFFKGRSGGKSRKLRQVGPSEDAKMGRKNGLMFPKKNSRFLMDLFFLEQSVDQDGQAK